MYAFMVAILMKKTNRYYAYLFVLSCEHDNEPWESVLPTWQGGHGVCFRRWLHSVGQRAHEYLRLSAISSGEDYLEHS